MATETQTYLDEAKTPSIKTLLQARDDLQVYVPNVGQFQQQLVLWAQLIEEAMITEANDGLVAFMREALQWHQDLVQRINQARHIQRRLVIAGKELNELDGRIRTYITDEGLGYTV